MPVNQTHEWFDDMDTVVAEPPKFKEKLEIGENVYASLQLKNRVGEAYSAALAAYSGAALASSSAVATTFFPATGFLALLGVGAAVTPIGWIVAASILSGCAGYGLMRQFTTKSDDVIVIPKFINTPLDILAYTLFSFMASLALKVAESDGNIHILEKNHHCCPVKELAVRK